MREKTIVLALLMVILFSNKVNAQNGNFVCLTDSVLVNQGLTPQAEAAFVNSTFGNVFTPKGELRILLIFAGFTNDGDINSTGINWPYNDGVRPPGKSFPNNLNDYFYTNTNQFNIQNTDNSISNYYYHMSSSSGNPLKLIADVFPERINVTADIITDTSASAWLTYNDWVMDSIAAKYPNFDFRPYDNRDNQPLYAFDNTDTTNFPRDNVLDYVVVAWRYNDNPLTDPNITPPNQRQLSDNNYSGGAYAGISNQTFTDSLSVSYQIKNGYTVIKGFSGINTTTFTHELGHNLYSSPHYNGANNVCGQYFNNNYGWGMMRSGGPHVFDCALGWERWWLGWIELTTGSTQVSGDIQSISQNGTYNVRDFITHGDVMRIKLPHVKNQYIWLENHQRFSKYDDRLGFANNGIGGSIPNAPRGIVAYIERLHPNRTSIISFTDAANGIRYLDGKGNFDYSNQFSSTEPTSNEAFGLITYDFIKGNENPLGPHSQKINIRNNFIDSILPNRINYDGYTNGCFGCIGNENRQFWKEDGVFTYGGFGIDMNFNSGDKIDLSSNPMIKNLQPFNPNPAVDSMGAVYLNGISFAILNYNVDGSADVLIKMDDYDICNDTRYTGNIILSKHISNYTLPSLNIKQNKVLVVTKSGSPNKQFITSNNDYINESVFTCLDSSYFHMESDSRLFIYGNSTMILKAGSKLELESGASLLIFDGELIIEDGAELILHNGATLVIGANGTLTMNNSIPGLGLIVGDNTLATVQAQVQVKGTLAFGPTAIFLHDKAGFYNFYSGHTLIVPPAVPVKFTGLGKTVRFLKLQNFAKIDFVTNSVDFLNGLVEYESGSRIGMFSSTSYRGNNVTFNSLQITNNPSTQALHIDNPLQLITQNCEYNNFGKAIKVSNSTIKVLLLSSIYNSNTFAIDIQNVTNAVIAGSLISSSGVYSVIGISASNSFINVSTTEIIGFRDGVLLNNVVGAYFTNCNIRYNFRGINGTDALVFLRSGTEVHNNDFGIEMYGTYDFSSLSYTSMLTMGDVGCASVYDNLYKGIVGRDFILNIDAVQHAINRGDPNNIIPNKFENNIMYTFDICYLDANVAPTQIGVQGNYWGTNSGNINPSNYRIKINLGCLDKPNHGVNVTLLSNNFSNCVPTTSCLNCEITSGSTGPGNPGGGNPNNSNGNGSGMTAANLAVRTAFEGSNVPFMAQDIVFTRLAFEDISVITLDKNTNNTWTGTAINGDVFSLDGENVHRIQVSKVIFETSLDPNARMSYLPKNIFEGMEQGTAIESFTLFPNPASNVLNIDVNEEGLYSFSIINILGEEVDKGNFTTKTQIKTEKLSGIYTIKVVDEDGMTNVKQFVVNH